MSSVPGGSRVSGGSEESEVRGGGTLRSLPAECVVDPPIHDSVRAGGILDKFPTGSLSQRALKNHSAWKLMERAGFHPACFDAAATMPSRRSDGSVESIVRTNAGVIVADDAEPWQIHYLNRLNGGTDRL